MTRLFLILFLASFSLPLPGQTLFTHLGKHHLPCGTPSTLDVALGDMDGDGDLDLVWANEGYNRVQLNDGHGRFSDLSSSLPGLKRSMAVALGDLDGDGDLDIIFGNTDQPNQVLRNDGQGNFTDVSATAYTGPADWTSALALGDVDGDGDLDLLHNSTTNGIRLYLNDGKGIFTHKADLPSTQSSFCLALGDLDGDGDLDLVRGGLGTAVILVNDGTGSFTPAPTWHLPAVNTYSFALALADVDGDGDLDLFCGNHGNITPQNQLFRNNGAGVFTDASPGNLPPGIPNPDRVTLADLDGDSDLDLLLISAGKILPLLNDGSGRFATAPAPLLPAVNRGTWAIATGDLDQDGDLDMAAGNYRSSKIGAPNTLLMNDGTGHFTDLTAGRVQGDATYHYGIIPIDADGDGDMDIVSMSPHDSKLTLLVNDGTGKLKVETSAFSSPLDALYLTAGDIDGNGSVDLVTSLPGRLDLYLINGAGRFLPSPNGTIPVANSGWGPIVMGDVDGDGDLDLVAGVAPRSNYSPTHLFMNDGTGRFTDVSQTHLASPPDWVLALLLKDLDGDGDLDLVCGCGGRQNTLHSNDGSGRFTPMVLPKDTDQTTSLAALDIDGDGDLDLACGNDTGRHRLYRNDGTNGFTDITATNLPPAPGTYCLIAVDLDGDGNEDLFAGGSQGAAYLRGDGTGRFVDATATHLPSTLNIGESPIICDLDGDGDQDLMICAWTGGFTIFANTRRQLGAPYIATPGTSYRLDLLGRYTPAPTRIIALPFWSTARADLSLGVFGRLFLDPTRLHPLPARTSAGTVNFNMSISLNVPPDRSLIGSNIHFQAFMMAITGPTTWEGRFTNLVSETISGL